MKFEKKIGSRGRPRAFDADEALEAAMRVFWQKGYEGATLSDLTAAMGINRPSMYAAFGDKETLFRKVLDHYAEGPAAYIPVALNAPTARVAIEQLLYGAIDLLTAPENPPNCLITQGALVCGDEAESVRQELTLRRQAGTVLLRDRFERGVREGDLPPDTDSTALASYFATVIRGLGVSAASGAGREELTAVAQIALRVWPVEDKILFPSSERRWE